MNDNLSRKVQDLSNKFDSLEKTMTDGFSRIEKRFDQFLISQEKQDDQIDTIKTSVAVHENKLSMFAGGQLVVSIAGSFLAWFLGGKKW
jgi:uncharacterized protein YhaN